MWHLFLDKASSFHCCHHITTNPFSCIWKVTKASDACLLGSDMLGKNIKCENGRILELFFPISHELFRIFLNKGSKLLFRTKLIWVSKWFEFVCFFKKIILWNVNSKFCWKCIIFSLCNYEIWLKSYKLTELQMCLTKYLHDVRTYVKSIDD